jgi:hypothetical protein
MSRQNDSVSCENWRAALTARPLPTWEARRVRRDGVCQLADQSLIRGRHFGRFVTELFA